MQATLSSLPDEVVDTVGVTVVHKLFTVKLWSWSSSIFHYYIDILHSRLTIAFVLGKKYVPGNGFHNVGTHTDTPCLQLKPVLKDIIVGLLCLRKCGRSVTCPELEGKCSIFRGLYVYGTVVPVHGRDAAKLQYIPEKIPDPPNESDIKNIKVTSMQILLYQKTMLLRQKKLDILIMSNVQQILHCQPQHSRQSS